MQIFKSMRSCNFLTFSAMIHSPLRKACLSLTFLSIGTVTRGIIKDVGGKHNYQPERLSLLLQLSFHSCSLKIMH
jgi:hypothetical protein